MHRCIFNGTVVTEDRLLPYHAVILNDDRIEAILPMLELETFETNNGDMDYFDARGSYIMPGIIDVHSDYIENVIQPRPQSLMDFEMSLREAEKQLLGHGITTMYHSLSLMNTSMALKAAVRQPHNVSRLVELIRVFHEGRHLVRHRFHARYEIDNLDGYEHLITMIEAGDVHLLSLMDHTPGQGQYRDLTKYAENFKANRGTDSDEEFEKYLEMRVSQPRATHEMLVNLTKLAKAKGIVIASHDDDSLDKLHLVHRDLEADISEFPITMEVAAEAQRLGLKVVMGAPNVLMGKSHSGNLSACDALFAGLVDVLCSDYYPAALLNAVFKLVNDNLFELPQAVRLVTLHPAQALDIAADFGSVVVGKKADLLVVSQLNQRPLVHKVFIDGKASAQYQYRVG
ncbi:MAG: alpha-D-ribose 1-methylphosphonate 5-triphosphate diphosphatase [Symbiobacteriaceae bacterium]|nr:alpha-D-ribose 1-methylphosphonate 5-triphosphate diphosphatase [Symbiobacteriaceae bacterium]